MSSLRLSLLGVVQQIRVAVREGLDQCPNRLYIVQRTWTDGRIGKGTSSETILIDFGPYLPIRQMSAHEVAASGGQYHTSDLLVSRITPSNQSGSGFTPSQLKPLITTDGVEIIYRITGDNLQGDYNMFEFVTGGRASHPGGYPGRGGTYSMALVLRQRRDSPNSPQ